MLCAQMLEFHKAAPWASGRCKQAMRTVSCMLAGADAASSVASKQYCRYDCEHQMALCEDAARVLGDAFRPFREQCEALPHGDVNCVSAQRISSLVDPPADCPKNLVIPDSASKGDGVTIHWADGSSCAVPCPNDLV